MTRVAGETEAAPALVFPVGQVVGAFPTGDPPAIRSYRVRVGTRIHELSTVDFAAWTLALGDESAAQRGRGDLVRRLGATGVGDPETAVDRLLAGPLMVEVPTTGAAPVEFARRHRLVPILYGLGNTPGEPDTYAIGLVGEERIRVSRAVFELWAWAPVEPDLWAGCVSFAGQQRRAGEVEPATTDPARVLAGLLTSLPDLLLAQAAYLDAIDG